MHHSLTHAFTHGYDQAVLIGSDTPDLPPAYITDAFQALTTSDISIGPSPDGGYYLIATKHDRYLPQIFTGIPWSTPAVLPTTLAIIKHHHHTVHLLPPWQDVDTPNDLQALIQRSKNTAFKSSQTFTYLTRHHLIEEHP
jgi:uncharacterized protein